MVGVKSSAEKRSKAGSIAARRLWTPEELLSRRIKKTLKQRPGHTCDLESLRQLLKQNQSSNLTITKKSIKKAVQHTQDKHRRPNKAQRIPSYLLFEKGGKSVRLVVNSGTHPNGTGIVSECRRAFGKESVPKSLIGVLGLHPASRAKTFDVHLRRKQGLWSNPDFAVALFRGRSARPYAVHSFEVIENKKNVSSVNLMADVAQIFSCSRNYSRCWVVVHQDIWKALKDSDVQRINRVASQLGVGILTYSIANQSHTWKRIRNAKPLRDAKPASTLKRLELNP